MSRRIHSVLLLTAGIALGCVLSLCQSTASAQRTGGEPPFANSVEQRQDMVAQLRDIKELLKEQNALLKSGKLQVVVTLPDKN